MPTTERGHQSELPVWWSGGTCPKTPLQDRYRKLHRAGPVRGVRDSRPHRHHVEWRRRSDSDAGEEAALVLPSIRFSIGRPGNCSKEAGLNLWRHHWMKTVFLGLLAATDAVFICGVVLIIRVASRRLVKGARLRVVHPFLFALAGLLRRPSLPSRRSNPNPPRWIAR